MTTITPELRKSFLEKFPPMGYADMTFETGYEDILKWAAEREALAIKEFAEYLKGQLGSYEIQGKPLKDFEYDAPYKDTYGAIDGSVVEFLTQTSNTDL